MRTVEQEQVASSELVLAPGVQEALGELVNAAKDGLLALSVGVGLGVLAEMMEAEVDEVVGPRGQHDPGRAAVRHGHEDGQVTLGGRRVGVKRPRARTADGEREVALKTYEHFADRDPLTRVVLRPRQADLVSNSRKQRAARMQHQALSIRRDIYVDPAPIMRHLQGDPPESILRASTTRRIPAPARSQAAPNPGATTISCTIRARPSGLRR